MPRHSPQSRREHHADPATRPDRRAIFQSNAVSSETFDEISSNKYSLSPVRVLCVDDHEVLAEGLQAQFSIEGTIRVVGRLSSTQLLMEESLRLTPDVVILDIEMPGPDAFESADRLRHRFPNVRIVFLSAHVRDGYIAAAYKCGASGYFSKGDDLKAITAGVLEIAGAKQDGTNEFVMGSKVRERCLEPRGAPMTARSTKRTAGRRPPSTPLGALSEREIEVLRLIGKGQSRTDIARELSRSVKTVDGHQGRIMNKLGIATRADLMRFAIREGLAEA